MFQDDKSHLLRDSLVDWGRSAEQSPEHSSSARPGQRLGCCIWANKRLLGAIKEGQVRGRAGMDKEGGNGQRQHHDVRSLRVLGRVTSLVGAVVEESTPSLNLLMLHNE